MKGSSGSGARPGRALEADVEHRRPLRRADPQAQLARPLAGGGDAQGLEQRAVGHVAGVAVEIVEAPVPGVAAVHDRMVVARDLEAPGWVLSPLGAQRARSRILSRVSRLAMERPGSKRAFSQAHRAIGGDAMNRPIC